MCNVHGQIPKLYLLVIGQALPAARSDPIVDEGLHAADVVAADDATIDGVRNGSDFGEQMRVSSLSVLQDVK